MALQLKNEGNKAYLAGHYERAHELYSKAIALDNTNPVLYANRAQCGLKLEQHGSVIQDATKTIELDPNNIKAYFRRAAGYCGIMEYKKAVADYLVVTQKAPADALARANLAECRKVMRAQAFLRAIEVQDEPSVLETIETEHMPDDDGLGVLYTESVSIDFVHKVVEHFKNGNKISRKKVYEIVKSTAALFEKEQTLTELECDDRLVTICGDTHGQFYDLLDIFKRNGWPSKDHAYLFNGDFVDRGSWSTEIALTLYLLKLALPNSIFLNRGNHETDSMNLAYGFAGECKAKYSSDLVFRAFSESFAKLPLACLVDQRFLVVHGGLFSNDDVTLKDIRDLNRFATKQPGQEGLMMEMLWTDPQTERGRGPSKRGIGLQFGPDVTEAFCKENKLEAVIRSHEVREEGYSLEHNGRLITVFSAPNYCDSQGNKGAYINVRKESNLEFTTFTAVPHPDIPPMAYASSMVR